MSATFPTEWVRVVLPRTAVGGPWRRAAARCLLGAEDTPELGGSRPSAGSARNQGRRGEKPADWGQSRRSRVRNALDESEPEAEIRIQVPTESVQGEKRRGHPCLGGNPGNIREITRQLGLAGLKLYLKYVTSKT